MRRLFKLLGIAVLFLLLVVSAALLGFRFAAEYREKAFAADIAPASGRFIQTRSGKLFLQDEGPRDGTPVVLFHGTAAWSELWRKTISALTAAGYRVIALDLPPFGFSDRPGTYTRSDQAERVVDALEALQVRDVIIVGHSFGAGAAVETVMISPKHVRGLILVDAALGLTAPASDTPPFFLQYPRLREVLVSATITNPLLTRTLFSLMIEKKERATPEVAAVIQQPMIRRDTTREFGKWLSYFLSNDRAAMSSVRPNYGKLAVKTAIIWGDKDTITPMAQAEDLRSLIPAASLTVLPGLGHIPQIEDPDAFNRTLIAHLQSM